jgi:hypothetical protein
LAFLKHKNSPERKWPDFNLKLASLLFDKNEPTPKARQLRASQGIFLTVWEIED